MHTEVVFALVSSRTLFLVDKQSFQPQLRLVWSPCRGRPGTRPCL